MSAGMSQGMFTDTFGRVVRLVVVAIVAAPIVTPSSAALSVLQFAWPEGTVAVVEAERTRTEQDGTAPARISFIQERFRMEVLRHSEGRLIRFSAHEKVPGGTLAPSQTPTVIVDNNGRLVRIEATAQAIAEAERQLEAVRHHAPLSGPGKLWGGVVSPEVYLTRRAAEWWEPLVGAWVGRPLVMETFHVEIEWPHDVMVGLSDRLRGTAGMLAISACNRAGSVHPCATFGRTLGSKASLASALGVAQNRRETDSSLSVMLDYREDLRVTLDTRTMLPLQFVRTTVLRVDGSKVSEADGKFTTVDRDEMTFTYSPVR